MNSLTLQEEIWQWVAAVPPGKVATYGQIARLAGKPRHSRYVGHVLKQLPDGSTLPWYRVLHGSGQLAFPPGSTHWRMQKQLLEEDGTRLTNQRVDLKRYQWDL